MNLLDIYLAKNQQPLQKHGSSMDYLHCKADNVGRRCHHPSPIVFRLQALSYMTQLTPQRIEELQVYGDKTFYLGTDIVYNFLFPNSPKFLSCR